MAIVRSNVSNVEALAEWMQTNAVPSVFKAVTYSDGVLAATDEDDNVVLETYSNSLLQRWELTKCTTQYNDVDIITDD